MAPELVVPATLEQAAVAAGTDGAVVLAGGTALVPLLRQGLVEASSLVWLGRIQSLSHIQASSGAMTLGAGVTIDRVATDPAVAKAYPALARAAAQVGNLRVRCSATLGGHVAHADPRQDLPPVLIVLGATIHLTSAAAGTRTVPAARFFTGFLETAALPGELVTAIELPAPGRRSRASYLRFNPAGLEDYPTVGAAAAVDIDDEGGVAAARVALSGVGPVPCHFVSDDFAGLPEQVAARCDPVSDRRGSAAYKRSMAAVWARRALAAALARPALAVDD